MLQFLFYSSQLSEKRTFIFYFAFKSPYTSWF